MFIIFSMSLCLFFTQMPWNTTICISFSQRNIYKLLCIVHTILLVTKTKDTSQRQLWQCNMLSDKNIYPENIMCDIFCLYYKLSQSPWTYEPKYHPETTACTLTSALLCFEPLTIHVTILDQQPAKIFLHFSLHIRKGNKPTDSNSSRLHITSL